MIFPRDNFSCGKYEASAPPPATGSLTFINAKTNP